jgi:glycosyltransferase involved in cell wall biosynthesis
MTPFAANIINIVAESPNLEVYAIVVSRIGIDYKDYINVTANNCVEFWHRPRSLYGKFIEKFYNYKLFRRIKILVNNHHIDYIHFLTGDYTLHPFFAKLRKTATVVYTVHDLIPHDVKYKIFQKHRWYRKYIIWGVRQNIKKADILVTCNKDQFKMLKEKYPSKLTCFHQFPTLITQGIISGTDSCPELDNVRKYILFFGSVQKYKGVEVLYNTFLSKDIFPSNYSLVIAGSGDWYFKRDSKESNVVRINRFIKDSEIKSLFCNASCVVYPYISATQSGVLTLAYRFGVPAIVSDIPYFLDSAEDNETIIFFKNQNENDLAKKMEKLLFDTNIEEIKHHQQIYYVKHYSYESLLKEIATIYCTNFTSSSNYND